MYTYKTPFAIQTHEMNLFSFNFYSTSNLNCRSLHNVCLLPRYNRDRPTTRDITFLRYASNGSFIFGDVSERRYKHDKCPSH